MKVKFYALLLIIPLGMLALLAPVFSAAQEVTALGRPLAEYIPAQERQGSLLALPQFLKQLEKKYAVTFLYRLDVVADKQVASIDLNGKSLADALHITLAPFNLTFNQLDANHYSIHQALPVDPIRPKNAETQEPNVSSSLLYSLETLSFRKTSFPILLVKGTVQDDQGQPLPGVSILVKGTTTGTATGSDGAFSISVPEGNETLVISFIGYLTQEVPINNRTTLTVTLTPDIKSLGEVVVIGYGTVKKSDVTGAVSSVTSEKITQVNAVSNVAQALQGQAAGVQVSQRSGQPGENISIIIRGNNSIQASNSPLYVVDGLPLDGLSAQLNPSDIESIEVLKDASSTAIYGSRGANGVIMITTKKGREGKPRVSYNGYYGVQSLRKKLDLIDAREFATLQNEVNTHYNAENPTLPAKRLWSPSQIDSLGTHGTDWQDLVYRDAPVQNHDVSVSGGTEVTKYYTSVGYYNQQGIIENSGFKRYSFRGNFEYKLSKKLSSFTSFSLQQSNYAQNNYFNADGNGGVPFTTMVMPPTQGVYDASGKYTVFTGVPWGQTNPYAMAQEEKRQNRSLRLIGNAALTYTILEGLKLRVSAGIDNNWGREDYYAPRSLSLFANGGAYKNYGNSSTFVNENILSYTHKFNNHLLDVLGGITYQSSKSEQLNSGTFTNFLTDIYQNNNLNAASVRPTNTNTYFDDSKLISYLGRLNYTFADKYLLTLTGRYDGSSRFSKNHKFAFFPSGAIGWRVSQESFMQDISAISNLKLRASYGVAGNQAIANYRTLGELSNTNITLNNTATPTYFVSRLENSSLKWETTKQADFGIDLGLFGERLQLTADYYNKRTVDLLLDVSLPTSSGFGTALQNVGEVGNKGFEFQLTGKILTNGPITWTSTLTYSSNRTKVLDLGKDAEGNPIQYKEVGTGGNWFPLILGQPMQQLFGYQVLGVYQTDAEAVANGESTKRAGDYKFQTSPGGILPNDNRVILSNFQPKFTYGFNNDFTYRNFTFSVLMVGSFGNDIANEFRKYNITLNGNWVPTKEAYDNRWVEGKGGTFDRPSVNSGSSIRDYANSLWIENGSYLRVRNITLGYNIPASALKWLKIASLRVYVSGQNLITVTKYSGYDPESSFDQSNITPRITGWDRGVYPATKSITGGVKIDF